MKEEKRDGDVRSWEPTLRTIREGWGTLKYAERRRMSAERKERDARSGDRADMGRSNAAPLREKPRGYS